MKTFKIAVLLALVTCAISVANGQETPITLEAAKEQGRIKSRYLKETKSADGYSDAIPKANLADFQKSVEPILTKSCLDCHGPKKVQGQTSNRPTESRPADRPDVERWREVYNALSKSEMPPENEPDYALADADRGNIVDWLSEELNKASLVRRNSKEHSSFRRLTKYEYDYALQDLLGLPYSLANKLPPETTTEDGFKNSSELLANVGHAVRDLS